MPLLSAKFRINFSTPCFVAWPEGVPVEIRSKVDGFDVLLRFLLSENGREKRIGELGWTSALYEIELLLSRVEQAAPPSVVVSDEGLNDLTLQSGFLRERLPAYSATAHVVVNRVLTFFQYSLNTPMIRPVSKADHALRNPTWYDDLGRELRGRTNTSIVDYLPGMSGEFGVGRLTPDEVPALVDFIHASQEPSLVQVLLSGAQTALI
jgi:hypothetical protein